MLLEGSDQEDKNLVKTIALSPVDQIIVQPAKRILSKVEQENDAILANFDKPDEDCESSSKFAKQVKIEEAKLSKQGYDRPIDR